MVLTLALVSFGGAVWMGGNGFVSSFVAGLVFGAVTRHEVAAATDYTESTGLFMSYGVWAVFGAVLLGPMLQNDADRRAIGYAVASLDGDPHAARRAGTAGLGHRGPRHGLHRLVRAAWARVRGVPHPGRGRPAPDPRGRRRSWRCRP